MQLPCTGASGCKHQAWERMMSLDTIMVVIAVTAIFATLVIVLGWADKQTNGEAKKS